MYFLITSDSTEDLHVSITKIHKKPCTKESSSLGSQILADETNVLDVSSDRVLRIWS